MFFLFLFAERNVFSYTIVLIFYSNVFFLTMVMSILTSDYVNDGKFYVRVCVLTKQKCKAANYIRVQIAVKIICIINKLCICMY